MDFNTVAPYLPTPVLAMKTLFDLYGVKTTKMKQDDLNKHNLLIKNAKADLLSTALAVTGFFLAFKYADRVGLNLAQVALLAVPVFPYGARKAVGGYFVFSGIQGAISAVKVHNTADLAKNVGLAALGYFGNTPFVSTMLDRYVFSKF